MKKQEDDFFTAIELRNVLISLYVKSKKRTYSDEYESLKRCFSVQAKSRILELFPSPRRNFRFLGGRYPLAEMARPCTLN